jgi:hypothetical protein
MVCKKHPLLFLALLLLLTLTVPAYLGTARRALAATQTIVTLQFDAPVQP